MTLQNALITQWAININRSPYFGVALKVPEIDVPNRVFRMGKATILRQGNAVTRIGFGTKAHIVLAASDI